MLQGAACQECGIIDTLDYGNEGCRHRVERGISRALACTPTNNGRTLDGIGLVSHLRTLWRLLCICCS